MARHHVLGALKMVDLNGGPATRPVGSFVATMLETFLSNRLLNIQAVGNEWPSSFQGAGQSGVAAGKGDRCVNPCDKMASQFFHGRNQSVKHQPHYFVKSV